ncbi:MAG TPA: hypothetical protein VMJ93_11265 [Verrucomicrobiae bacterium]|nr:hypothetical protein [Verrucomicrobiae bacterium]
MALYLNSFPVDVTPTEASLPYLDYPDWQSSTSAKKTKFNQFAAWRYEMSQEERGDGQNMIRMVLLKGPQVSAEISRGTFDLGRFWRIGCLFIEDAVSAQFAKLGFAVEHSKFERFVLRPYSGTPDDRIELATGLSFSARRPFREDRYRFALSFQWVVRAMFRDSLTNDSLARIALGMPVIYKPAGASPPELLEFTNRYIGRVRSIDPASASAVVMCKDDEPRTLPLGNLRLESSPAVIRLYEQAVRLRTGPSQILRTVQQLKMSFTKDNRRNVSALRDRLDKIRAVLQQAGSSRDQLILPLASFQTGSVSIGLNPSEAVLGDSW